MKRDIDPATLRMFVAVCEEGSIARAAEREAVVASAVSKRMAALEALLGVRVLARERRAIEPTAAGEALLRRARDLLANIERLHAELSEFATGVHGSVRVLASLSAVSEFLPDDIASFLTAHSGVRVSVDERVSADIVRGVREGTADFGVLWDAGDLSGVEKLPFRTDRLCVVVPPGHPLARRRSVAFADTLEFDQIEIRPGSVVQTTLRRTAALAGRTLHQRIQVTTIDAGCRAVAAGLGVAIVPREAVGPGVGGVRMVPLADAWSRRQFVICTRGRDTVTSVARLLIEHLAARAAASADIGRGGRSKHRADSPRAMPRS